MPSGIARRIVPVILTAIALTSGARVAVAQQVPPCTYDTCALRLKFGGLGGARVVQGATAVKAQGGGVFSHRIPVFETRTDSVNFHYVEYRSHAKRAGLLAIAGALAMSIGYAVHDDSPRENRGVQYSLISGGFIVGIIAGINKGRSDDHLQRAIWLYNRDLAR